MKSTLQRPILQQLIGRTNDIAVLPSGKSAWFNLYYITKNYRGRWKCKRIYDQANQTDTFIIKYVRYYFKSVPN
jgi:phenylacetate-CoA ligase